MEYSLSLIHIWLQEWTEQIKSCKNRPQKEGSRYEIFRDEELPLLAPLPATPYELAEWRLLSGILFNPKPYQIPPN